MSWSLHICRVLYSSYFEKVSLTSFDGTLKYSIKDCILIFISCSRLCVDSSGKGADHYSFCKALLKQLV